MCRREIPPGYLENPNLLQPLSNPTSLKSPDAATDDSSAEVESLYQWFYEGRNGWWEYDQRTTLELEEAYKDSFKIEPDPEQDESPPTGAANQDVSNNTVNKTCELLIAGFLYVIDFENMIQYRRNEPQRRRRIKRDQRDQITNMKGVAGIRIIPTTTTNPPISSGTSSNHQSINSIAPTPLQSRSTDARLPSQDEQDGTSSLTSRMGSISLGGAGGGISTRTDDSHSPNPSHQQQDGGDAIGIATSNVITTHPAAPINSLASQDQQSRNLGNIRAMNTSLQQNHPVLPQARNPQAINSSILRNAHFEIDHELEEDEEQL